MINDLEKEIKSLRQENEYLKTENADLKRQIEVLTKIPYDPAKPVSIIEYYCKKYLELFDDVLYQRLEKIKEEKQIIQTEYNHLMESEDKMALLAHDNEAIDQQINKIEQMIHDNLMKIENEKFTLNNHIQEVSQSITKLEEETTTYYLTLLKPLLDNNFNDFNFNFLSLVTIIEKRLSPLNIKIKGLIVKVNKEQNDVHADEQEITRANRILLQEKKELETKKINLTSESIDAMLDELASEIKRKTQLEEEIKELFENYKKEHLKTIKDEIEHFQIIELSNHDIALAMDDILMKIIDSLIHLDTQTNIEMQKMVELNHLNEKAQSFGPIKEEYNNVLNEYEYLQALYQEVNKQIEQIENYIKELNLALDANPLYQKQYDRYIKLLSDRSFNEEEILRLEKELEEVKKYRAKKVSDPFASSEMVGINQQMALLTTELNQKKLILDKIKETIKQDRSNKDLANLMNVIDDMLTCQLKLPDLYQKTRELTLLVDDKYQQLQGLRRKLQEYESLIEQIESIENELNNK